jgi:hypothetical protein
VLRLTEHADGTGEQANSEGDGNAG